MTGRPSSFSQEIADEVCERVAIAARQASSGRKIIPPWEMLDRWERERWLEVARAAIKTYREACEHDA